MTSPWRVLGLALAVQCGFSLLDQSLPALTGYVKADLGLSARTAGLAVSALAFGRIFGAYAAGVAADRLGERRVLVLGGFTAAGLIAVAAATPVPAVFPILFAAGLASAAGTPAGGRLVLLAFPPERRGLALGIRQTGIPVGGLIAAGLLPWIAHGHGWRWSLFVAACITGALVVPLARSRIGGAPPEPLLDDEPPQPGPARNRNVVLLTLWSCLLVSGQFAVIAFLALDLHARAGLSLATGSLFLALANGCGIVARVAWGAVSDRAIAFGRKPLLLVLTGVGLAGALTLLAVPFTAPAGVLAAVAVLAGLGLIGYQGLWVTMVAEAAGPQRVGTATGFAVSFTNVSIALTPPLYGAVADAAGSYRAIWAALSVVLALAFVPALLVHEQR
jgi:predicted MFS family arabinose efflux permease